MPNVVKLGSAKIAAKQQTLTMIVHRFEKGVTDGEVVNCFRIVIYFDRQGSSPTAV